jgi:hypothetical protein
MLLLVGCEVSKDTTEFDNYLKQLMSEPYNPGEGSKY